MTAVARRKRIDPEFGRRLRELREAGRLTQVQLGERADMPYQTVAKFERGEREPTWATLVKLADALGVGLDAFRTPAAAEPPPDAAGVGARPRGKRK